MVRASEKAPIETGPGLADQTAERIRQSLIAGKLVPGQQLSEASVSNSLDVSRNTLREAFRMLTHEGLLTQKPYRGVFVVVPSMASIVDIYRVRRMIECQAIGHAPPKHPASRFMRAAVEEAQLKREADDWPAVGTANMDFHAAVVALADSERLDRLYANISAELRLAFGLLDDAEYLHRPYVDLNAQILALYENDDPGAAAQALEDYLVLSERTVLASYARNLA
ncbi:MAG TPA: GntR family transcriptional regulator [Humibacter sp.]|nr:GntR family transcriptional regulator [Humibacter sp.]